MPDIVAELVTPHMAKVYEKSFAHWDGRKRRVALEEFLKFSVIASHMGNIFIPCVGEIDDIWHKFILETREYARLCEKIRPGNFLHHSGVTFDDYCSMKDGTRIVEEDLTVLASYVENFGPFTPETIDFWHFAKDLMRRHGCGLEDFNTMLRSLVLSGQREEACRELA